MTSIVESKGKDPLDALWNKADEAAKAGDFAGALFVLRSLAEKGVWQVYVNIGAIYESGGGGVEKDIQQALNWYRRAAFEGDDPKAHAALGRAYYLGIGLQRDVISACEHFEKAYRQGLPEAALYLGEIYSYGNGIKRNIARAKTCYEMAAAAEYFYAYGRLARIALEEGQFVASVRLSVKFLWLGYKILNNGNPSDPRRLGVRQVNT